MNSTLKYTILPLALVVLVVFGVTLVSMSVGDQGNAGGGEPTLYSPPLLFSYNQMAYNPTDEALPKRTFPGFVERTGDHHVPVPFWFRNPHPVPVRVAILGRSCTSCSSARLAVIPPEVLRAGTARAAVGGGWAGPDEPTDLVPPLDKALTDSLAWKHINVDDPASTVEVPPAAGEEAPTWGLLQLGVKVGDVGPKQLRVSVGLTAGDNPQVPMVFEMLLIGVPPFQLMPTSLQFGELAEGASPVTKELVYWSATRGSAAYPPLPKPTVTPNVSDPFLTVGEPVPLTPEELARFTTQMTIEAKTGPIRVAGAYKVPVTLSRSRPGASPPEPDIGPYERQLGFTADGTLHTVPVPVTATITGLVSLVGAEAANLRELNGRVDNSVPFKLTADRIVLALRPLPDEAKPKYLKPDVKPDGGQLWTLTVSVPAGSLLGTLPPDSVVVLEAKTADGVRKVRIPVKGTGFLGARPK